MKSCLVQLYPNIMAIIHNNYTDNDILSTTDIYVYRYGFSTSMEDPVADMARRACVGTLKIC